MSMTDLARISTCSPPPSAGAVRAAAWRSPPSWRPGARRRGRSAAISRSTRKAISRVPSPAAAWKGAVVGEAIDVIASGKPRMLEFGVADETAWRVGLSCGGKIRVYVEKVE